jgi:hypothetical protein
VSGSNSIWKTTVHVAIVLSENLFSILVYNLPLLTEDPLLFYYNHMVLSTTACL